MSVFFTAHSFNSISDPQRFVFIHIPRTGGSSLIEQIKKYCEFYIKGEPHQSASMIPNRDSAKIEWMGDEVELKDALYQKITVVRHPADRLVSIFNMTYVTTQEIANKSFRKPRVPWARKNLNKLSRLDINELIQMTDQQMIAEFDITEGFWSWGMTPGQVDFIDDSTEVHKFEDKTIWKRLDIPPIRENRDNDIMRWSVDDLNEKSLNIIREKFSSDYDKFGYKY